MDDLKMFKERLINEYMSNIDLDNINLNKIKEDLHRLIQEMPAIKLNYLQEEMISEDGTAPKKLERMESIEIIYTYEAEREIQGKMMTVPIPVVKKFLL